jgi:hypothetical protein
VGKKLKRAYSRGLEEYVLLIIGADPNREWVNEKGERHYQIIKSKSGEATTDEIKHNLDTWGVSWSKSSLGRKLESLRKNDLIIQGVKRGIYVVTQKGLEEFARRDLEFIGLGTLNTIASNSFDGLYSVNIESGKVKSLDLYARFQDEAFLKDFIGNVKKKIENLDFDEAANNYKRITLSFDPEERKFMIQMLLQKISMLVIASPDEHIRLLQDLGADDEMLKKVFDAYEKA